MNQNQKGFALSIIILITFLVLGVAVGAYILGNKYSVSVSKNEPAQVAQTSPTQVPQISTSPTQTQPTIAPSNIPAGWSTYVNTQYGFEISYPSNYDALDDSNNLYGWPNGVVLFYAGGQSQDVAVEAWDTQAQYQAKYSTPKPEITVHEVNGKFITIADLTEEAQNTTIISTFVLAN